MRTGLNWLVREDPCNGIGLFHWIRRWNPRLYPHKGTKKFVTLVKTILSIGTLQES
jgi:hypothetical protein